MQEKISTAASQQCGESFLPSFGAHRPATKHNNNNSVAQREVTLPLATCVGATQPYNTESMQENISTAGGQYWAGKLSTADRSTRICNAQSTSPEATSRITHTHRCPLAQQYMQKQQTDMYLVVPQLGKSIVRTMAISLNGSPGYGTRCKVLDLHAPLCANQTHKLVQWATIDSLATGQHQLTSDIIYSSQRPGTQTTHHHAPCAHQTYSKIQ